MKKSGMNSRPRVAIYTLGCKVNQFESACLLERFEAQGWEAVPFKEQAGLYLINTCAVTAEAQRQSAQMVRQVIRNHPQSLVTAAGCATQLFPQDFKSISGLDFLAGTFNKLQIPYRISQGTKFNSPQCLLSPESDHFVEAHFPFPGEKTRAFIRIQEGCNAECSYCLVPRARGRSRSLPLMEIVSGIRGLIQEGVKELILTGIHLGQYGEDLFPPENLVSLLEVLLPEHPGRSFRLSSLEPQEVTPGLIALFKKFPNLCPHLHIPLQAGEDLLLKKMNRTYSLDFYRSLIQTLYQEIPGASLGTDLIIGFPGETNALFQKAVAFISDLPLSYLHLFPYSPRPGTRAAGFPHPVPEKVKKERLQLIRLVDQQKREAFIGRCLGLDFSALVLRPDRGKEGSQALTENYLTVFIPTRIEKNTRIRVRLESRDVSKGLIGKVIS